MDENRHACDVRCRGEKPVDLWIGAEQRGSIPGSQPDRQIDPESLQQRVEVVAPGNRDGDVAHGVFEDQVPADDPCDQLAKRRIRIGISAPRLRNHRRELGVAETGERARAAQQEKREHQRRAGPRSNHVAARPGLAGGCRADRAEDPGPNHRPDGEHDQIACAERPFQAVQALGLLDQRRDRFACKELRHRPDSI